MCGPHCHRERFVAASGSHFGFVLLVPWGESFPRGLLSPSVHLSVWSVFPCLQVGSAIPLFLIHEYYATISPPGLVKKHWEIDQDR